MTTYCKKVWLNKQDSPSTGSVVAFHGYIKWREEKKEELVTFLEIADCTYKVRLHKTYSDTIGDFIKKLRKLAKTINNFADFLETTY